MRKGILSFFLLLFSIAGYCQFSLTVANYGPQDFSSLASSGSTNTVMPVGWYFAETGSNANTEYRAGTGTDNNGDTYSFGTASSSERALGGLRSGSLNPTIGFWVTNNTFSSITSILITYTGEQWRLGAINRTDRLDFQYSLNATSLTDGTWTDVNALDFFAPVSSGTTGALDGNAAPNRVNVNSIITGLTVPHGTTIFFRWQDVDVTGADDGLAIDDFSLAIVPSIPASTDHYRTVQSGGWDIPATWETSATGTDPWTAATLPPTSAANTITIRNGHTVSIDANTSADQLTIASGGILIYSGGTFTIDDATGDDVEIQNGGIFTLSVSPMPTFSGMATVNVATGGILRATVGGLTGAGTGVNSNNFVYQHQSILEWAPPGFGTFSTSNVIYFPNVDAVTIPIFRSSNPVQIAVGGGIGNNTIINGVFECNGDVIWQNAGTKTFRNGIKGNGKVDGRNGITPSGQFIINGITAELGGTDSLIVPVADGLLIGSATGTTVNLISDKLVHGNVSLLATNSFVDLGTNDLTVTGTISGGSTTSYIRTAGTGSLILNNIITNRSAPVGNSTYNPVSIDNASGYNWSVNVEDLVDVSDPTYIPNVPGAVQRTWNIIPSTNPATSGTTLVFSWDDNPSAVPRQTGVDYNNLENVQIWRKVPSGNPWPYDWIAVGVAQVPGGSVNNYRTATISNWTKFSPFAISTMSKPLPIKLISFEALKISSSASRLSWELAACCSSAARFEIERSTDARNYSLLSSLPGSETNRFYAYTDTRLARGITYYRLKMTDADGKITYSNVVAVINDKAGLLITSLAPNPVQSQATLSIANAATGPVQFAIYDLRGRVVQQWQGNAGEGSTTFTVQLGGLRAGVYHLLATGAGARSVYRFVKQ